MYKRYWKKIIEPLLFANGYLPSDNYPLTYYKDLPMGIRIEIEVQKGKWHKIIRVNINILDLINTCEEEQFPVGMEWYHLGEFLGNCKYDIWWSVEKADIKESFLQIEDVIKNTLLPALDKLEDKEFVEDFIRNIELGRKLGENF